MAKRSREHRQEKNPGYDENRPSREERKQQHRANRHATHQMLHAHDDPEGLVLPAEKKTRKPESSENGNENIPGEAPKRRYRVWKTKFWKRRDDYRSQKAELDAQWPVIPPDQLPDE